MVVKKWVLSWDLKESWVGDCMMEMGWKLNSDGAAYTKACAPNLSVWILGTLSRSSLEEHNNRAGVYAAQPQSGTEVLWGP